MGLEHAFRLMILVMLQLEKGSLRQIVPPQAKCQPWSPCWELYWDPLSALQTTFS